MKVKNIVIIPYLLLILLISSCTEFPEESKKFKEIEKGTLYEEEPIDEELIDNVLVQETTTLEEVKLKEYAQLIENIILHEHFLGKGVPMPYSRGMIETDFYYDSQKDCIAFIPKGDKHVYCLKKYQNYDGYYIDRYDLYSEPFDIQENEWLGVYKVNTDIDYSKYKLPELTKEDREDIALVCEDIYQRLSARQDTFEYNVYIGDFDRGYNDGIEFVAMYIALVGDRGFYIWAEIEKKNDEYGVWLFPSPFLPLDLPEPLYQNEEMYKEAINNIVSLNERVATLKK